MAPSDVATGLAEGVVLSASRLVKEYGRTKVLWNLSLDLHEASIVGLVGPNGSGKSTLLDIISGHVRADGGDVVYARMKLNLFHPHRIAALGVGRTFQDVGLPAQLSCLDVIQLGFGPEPGENIGRALIGSTVKDRIHHWAAEGFLAGFELESLGPKQIGTISYGERKVIALLSLIASNPEVILLDEPFAGLDPSAVDKVVAILRRLKAQRKAILFVEHDLTVVETLCDRVYKMDNGRVV